MRVSRAQAEENRRAVINVAARLFRERGFDGIGLSDLMAEAGLTHGGFYKQFASKDDLVAQACEHTLADSAEKWTDLIDSAGNDALTELVDRYLSNDHRDDEGDGCIFASLGCDVARRGPPLTRRFEASLKTQLQLLDRAMQASPAHGAQDDPVVAFSTMVGALMLSRMVDDAAFSRQILDKAADAVLHRDNAPKTKTRSTKRRPDS